MIKPASFLTYAAAFVSDSLTTNVTQILICYLGGFLCLIPLYYHPKSYLEESLLRTSLTTVGFRYSSIATLSLVVPVIFDCVTDIFFNFKKGKQNSDNTMVKEGFLNNKEKVLFLSGIVILPIVAFFPESTTNWAFIYLCCNKCQQIFVYGAVIISLSRYNNKCWSNKATYLMIIMISSGNSILTNINNNSSLGASVRWNLDILSFFLLVAGFLIFLFCSLKWYTGPFRRKFRLLFQETFSLVYITMTVLYIVTLGTFRGYYDRLEYYNERALIINNLIYFAYVLFIIIISMRMIKSEVVQGLVSHC